MAGSLTAYQVRRVAITFFFGLVVSLYAVGIMRALGLGLGTRLVIWQGPIWWITHRVWNWTYVEVNDGEAEPQPG